MNHPYLPNAGAEVKSAMLAELGLTDIAELYKTIPAELRLDRPLDLPPAIDSEAALTRHVRGLLARNVSTQERLSFLGGGTYPHHVPAVVDEVINRSEFLTAYAGEPYEDHGRFQALFEYTSQLAELLALDVVTVPTYDGFQATATAMRMAGRITGRDIVLIVTPMDPDKQSRVADYCRGSLRLIELPSGSDGAPDLKALTEALSGPLGDRVAGVYLEMPDRYGVVPAAVADVSERAHAAGAELIVGVDPVMLGVVTPPAELGADICCGDIQSLGVHQWFGGGHGGFLAVRDEVKYVMQLPSRIFGLAATEVAGEYGFGDVAYERTSFAVREEGNEWVGTAAALWGIAAGVYLSLMGPQGMAELGRTVLANTRYVMHRLGEIPGVRIEAPDQVHFREFVVDLSETPCSTADLIESCRGRGIDPGIPLDQTRLLPCITEVHTRPDLDALVDAVTTTVQNGTEA